ncbi:MAG: hypothetical protein WAT09_17010 [Paracoccaceae bacterium]
MTLTRIASLAALMLCLGHAAIAEVMDTLQRMQVAALARNDVTSAQIDRVDRSLKITMKNGYDIIMSPDNLDRELAALQTEAEKTAMVAHFVDQLSGIAQDDGPMLTEETLAGLRLVVSAQDLYSGTETVDIVLWRGPIAPGLAEYLVLDAQGSVAYLTSEDVIASGQTGEALRGRALDSLRAMLPQMQMLELGDAAWIVGVTLDGFYECSLMALPEIWTDLAAKHGRIGATCPERGALIVFQADDAEAVALMRLTNAANPEQVAYPVSPSLFEWTANGWTVLE